MPRARPPIVFTALWGLFAAAMLLGHAEMRSHGMKLANLIDISDPEIIQLASLD